MTDRFTVRPGRQGFTVYDLSNGEPAVIAMAPQTALSREDADHTAGLLNARAGRRDRGEAVVSL
jgi:hypothetical protein